MTTYATGIVGRSYPSRRAVAFARSESLPSVDFAFVPVSRGCPRCHKPAGRQLVEIGNPVATCINCKHAWKVRPKDEEIVSYRQAQIAKVKEARG